MTDRLALRRRLHEVAFRQAGYVSAAQALRVGYTYQAQKYHVDRGNWVRVDRGIFRLAEWPSAAHDNLARWTVWSEGRGVISYQSAADLHEMTAFNPPDIHLTLETVRARSAGVCLHWGRLEAYDIEDRGTYRLTTPIRTILDLTNANVNQNQLNEAVARALNLGYVTEDALRLRGDGLCTQAAIRLSRAIPAVGTSS